MIAAGLLVARNVERAMAAPAGRNAAAIALGHWVEARADRMMAAHVGLPVAILISILQISPMQLSWCDLLPA